jgi:hypothetical protein
LNEVRWLTIDEIAHYWAAERRTLSSLIRRELQLYLLNSERLKKGESRITELPSEDDRNDLFPKTTEMSREQLEEFCAKQKWRKPAFWFSEPLGSRRRGRPSLNSAIVQELHRIADAGELQDTLAAQCRHLERWAADRYSDDNPPKADSIENMIRADFKALKNRPLNSHNVGI